MANPFDEFDNVDSNPFDEFDEDAKKKKGPKERNYALAALDSPIGMLEGATTGQLNALGGLGASALGGVYGLLAPGMTAKEGYEKASQTWADTAGKVLAPRSESGKIAEDLMGKAIESFKEYAGDQGPKELLGAIPFAGPELAKDEKLGGVVSAAGTVIPEIGMLMPFMGIKKGVKAPEKAVEPTKPETPKAPNPFDQFDQATAERLAAGDETGQMALFDQPELMGKRNQFNAGDLGDWRIDENGMPIRVDKSMEAANVEAPLQRNLFGDELPTNGLEGTDIGITQAIDNTPANGQWAQRKGMTNRLGGNAKELMAGDDLLAAMQEANGMKLPFEETTLFDPKNPLPTETLGEMQRRTESQTALASTPLDPRDRPPLVDSVERPISPETIAAREQNRRVAERLPVKEGPLSEFEAVATPEEAVSMATANGFKDNAPTIAGKTVGSGPRYAAIMTNNPIIKYANTALDTAYRQADKFSRTYLTAKDGISPTWTKITPELKSQVRQVLLDGDRHQYRVTNEMMDKLNFTEAAKQFVNKYYEANDAMFKRWNEVLAAHGLAPIARREGHVPGIFKGAYKALVTDEKGVTGVIAADSRYELAAAKQYFAEKHPNYTIVDQGRKGLADYKNQSDIFSGMNDILQLLAEHDPKFKEVQTLVSEAIKHGNNSIYAFNKHELSKKGVLGNVGNKPWLDARKNTDDWFKAMVQYFEEGSLHHELQGPLNAIDKLKTDPQLPMPRTKEFLDHLTNKVTGKNTNNWVAHGGNGLIDAAPKLLGVGPRQSLHAASWVKNRINELFMGWGNFIFTGQQLVQPLQTGLPFLQLAGGRLGKNLSAPKAMFNGGTNFLLLELEKMTGKSFGNFIPEYQRQAYKYAEDVGLRAGANEMERAHEGAKSAFARKRDAVASFNIKLGDTLSRTPMFMAFVDMLHGTGMPMDRVLTTADNLTQFSMIDYNQLQRPEGYSKMGTIGQFAGGLTTFKHGYASQLVKLAQEASPVDVTLRKSNGMQRGIKLKPAQVAPVGLAAAATVAFAGLTGAPFYDEMDNLFGMLTDKFGGKKQNIRDTFLKNLPEWVKSGAVSSISNISVQSKFSSANMIPDTIPKLLSPHLEYAYKMADSLVDAALHRDKQSFDNAIMMFTPSHFKGAVEDTRLTDENGLVHNKEGQGTVIRTPEERALRKWTGLRSNKEVVQREADFKARQAEMADTDAKKKIAQDFGRSVMNEKPAVEKLQEYQERGGDPKSLLNIFKEKALEKKLTEQQRRDMQIKPTIGSMRKQEYYNKPGER